MKLSLINKKKKKEKKEKEKELNLTEEQLEIVNKNASFLVDKGLGTITILFLDSSKYLSFVGSQMLHVMNPMLTLVPYFKDFDKIAVMMEEEENVEYFLSRIEFYLNEKEKREK